jgi:hypothetical protein
MMRSLPVFKMGLVFSLLPWEKVPDGRMRVRAERDVEASPVPSPQPLSRGERGF